MSIHHHHHQQARPLLRMSSNCVVAVITAYAPSICSSAWICPYTSRCPKITVSLKNKVCGRCGEGCRLDLRTKSWRCDRTYAPRHQKKNRCNLKISIFHGSWFGVGAKLDLKTNSQFVLYWVRNEIIFFSTRGIPGFSDPRGYYPGSDPPQHDHHQ